VDAAADVATHHPATLVPDPAVSAQQHEDFFLWDLCGYLILRRDADGMGADWAARANASFEWARERGQTCGVSMPASHAAPFRRMISAPQVVHRLEWITGAGFCMGADFGVRTLRRGEGRQLIHAGLNWRGNEFHYVLSEVDPGGGVIFLRASPFR
jgi:hypothetical protein